MRRTSKLLSIIAAGVLTSSCMSLEQKNEIVLSNGEKFGDYIVKVYSGKICDKDCYEFELKDGYNKRYSVEFNDKGVGRLSLKGTNYQVRVRGSSNPKERIAILIPLNSK
ncbi:MAG: hypothetical protein Q8L27_00365 [archaeon]|nr:hypothetical protein [archaeon]